MILKSFLIEKNISLLDTYAISLFYGENIGLKDEIKFEIRNKYKDYEIINLNQDEVIKNKDLLEEQIYNISLFNKNKIIFINEVSDKIRKEIAYHTWNYKNQGPKSQGWYMYDKSGMLIAHIC